MTKQLTLLACIAFLLFSCEEIAPRLNPGSGTNNPNDQQRQVLIEEFTGVRCVNCPAGSDAIQTLKGIYGEQLIAVSIHTGFFAPPYPQSNEDFRTPEGASLLSYLGEPLGYPTSVINRKLFNGETDLQLGQSQWAGFIAEEFALAPQAQVLITKTYNPTTRALEAKVNLDILENIAENDVRISVMITQDQITDTQLTPSGVVDNYVHRHVLRDMMSAYDGDPVNGPLVAGDEVTRTFNYTLPQGWDADHCYIVAFLHHSGSEKTVIQAQEVKVLD
ncbi:MAG: Omp28 family outer membrane lipoprotein [Saprospiraceae bacterium]|nr:Omp28 family outer membrane lipoprotein [Saprospiraceae bacterium]